jgi:hypothetical protein
MNAHDELIRTVHCLLVNDNPVLVSGRRIEAALRAKAPVWSIVRAMARAADNAHTGGSSKDARAPRT